MEPIRQAVVIPLEDDTQVPVARRAAVEVGRRLHLPEACLARLEIVTVELANNILQHASTSTPGEIVLSSDPLGLAVQILAIDRGRGIADINLCLQDGLSTRATPGNGLGAVRRLSQNLDLYSAPGQGTVVSALVGPVPAISATAALCTALAGEVVSGDSWAIAPTPAGDLYLLVDGLGHGLLASDAAQLAVQIFQRSTHLPPAAILEAMHGPMRSTRGAAVAIAAVNTDLRQLIYCGVGNITCLLQAPDGRSQSLISHNGTVGHQMRRVQEFRYTFLPESLLLLTSDGISTQWKLSNYPGIVHHQLATIAGVLYRDAARRRDDASLLIGRLSDRPIPPAPAQTVHA